MKNKIKFLSVVAAALVMSSCSDFLDTTPSTAVTTSEAIECYDDAVAALVGVYDAVQGNSSELGWYGARAVYYGDVRGDLMQNEADGSRTRHLYDLNYDANNNNPDMWTKPYDAIRRASNLIEAINTPGQIKDADQYAEALADFEAQCVVIRALAHFDLCKVYGPLYVDDPTAMGVPIVDFVAPPSYQPERNTVAEVYEFVTDEIEGYKANLYKSTVAGESYGFVDYWTAQALLSRIYLFMGDFTKALAAAEDVIDNSPYALLGNEDYPYIWGSAGEGCSEFIWEIISTGADDWVDREGVPYLLSESGYADYILTPTVVEYFENHPNDVRVTTTAAPQRTDRPYLTRYGTDKMFCTKYPGNGVDPRYSNIRAVRIAEVYLNAAEAAFHVAAARVNEFFNPIASRDEDYVEPATITLDMIIEQRGIELLGEGDRYFTLARNNKSIDRTNRYTHIFPDPQAEVYSRDWFKAILPIPIAEMNANKNPEFKQNPGYGE